MHRSKVHPTIWFLGNLVLQHTKEMKAKYGLGLGLNSVEGREAKHIAISKYPAITSYLHQWEQVFCHDYIFLIWLCQHGYNAKIKTPSNTGSYIPNVYAEKVMSFVTVV